MQGWPRFTIDGENSLRHDGRRSYNEMKVGERWSVAVRRGGVKHSQSWRHRAVGYDGPALFCVLVEELATDVWDEPSEVRDGGERRVRDAEGATKMEERLTWLVRRLRASFIGVLTLAAGSVWHSRLQAPRPGPLAAWV